LQYLLFCREQPQLSESVMFATLADSQVAVFVKVVTSIRFKAVTNYYAHLRTVISVKSPNAVAAAILMVIFHSSSASLITYANRSWQPVQLATTMLNASQWLASHQHARRLFQLFAGCFRLMKPRPLPTPPPLPLTLTHPPTQQLIHLTLLIQPIMPPVTQLLIQLMLNHLILFQL